MEVHIKSAQSSLFQCLAGSCQRFVEAQDVTMGCLACLFGSTFAGKGLVELLSLWAPTRKFGLDVQQLLRDGLVDCRAFRGNQGVGKHLVQFGSLCFELGRGEARQAASCSSRRARGSHRRRRGRSHWRLRRLCSRAVRMTGSIFVERQDLWRDPKRWPLLRKECRLGRPTPRPVRGLKAWEQIILKTFNVFLLFSGIEAWPRTCCHH